MGNVRKKYVQIVDISRLLLVFSISFLVGVFLSKVGFTWPLCFAVIMIISLILGQLSQKLLERKMGDEFIVSKTLGFMIFSISMNIFLAVYLIINQEYMMLIIAVVMYALLLILQMMGVLK